MVFEQLAFFLEADKTFSFFLGEESVSTVYKCGGLSKGGQSCHLIIVPHFKKDQNPPKKAKNFDFFVLTFIFNA